ncbi:hypothetical protein Tdes44962_MAKER10146 [Teratosphaeria destructans]|uniref:Uncharacterized protein n=1 Tax=Teratosphaeria destructans TaxID=418781 RepID=A0A9W7SNL9_9PEZI|nr:hypothetical protein Tdes44962_MAKER10146 [Teratosphaeria destructans]
MAYRVATPFRCVGLVIVADVRDKVDWKDPELAETVAAMPSVNEVVPEAMTCPSVPTIKVAPSAVSTNPPMDSGTVVLGSSRTTAVLPAGRTDLTSQ